MPANLLKPLLTSGKTCAAWVRPPIRSTAASSTRTGAVPALPEDRRVGTRREDTYKILKGLKSRFEEHYGMRYTDKALRSCLGSVEPLHHRSLHARQGHRRDRRGGRLPAAAAGAEQAQEEHRGERHRAGGRQDRPHPAQGGDHDDKEALREARQKAEDGGVRPGSSDRRLATGPSSCRAPASNPARSRSGRSCWPARRVSARPRSAGSWRASWASSCCASTCRSTWSGTPCRA
jgi:hypothetical protein